MTSTSDADATRYLEALKELLRDRRLGYRDLAEALPYSLPTVKRDLNKPTIPLSRLLELCHAAGIPFDDLHRRAEERRPLHYIFTEDQESVFLQHEGTLTYLTELGAERSPAEIAARHDLDPASTHLYLELLASVGLIERTGPDQAELLVSPPFGFGPDSRVLRERQRTFIESITERVIMSADEGRCATVLKALRLTEGDYRRMVADLVNVVERFAAVSEGTAAREEREGWMVSVACGPADESEAAIPRLGPDPSRGGARRGSQPGT